MIFPVALGEENESWVDSVVADGLYQPRHGQEVCQGGGEGGSEAPCEDEWSPRRHHLHDL